MSFSSVAESILRSLHLSRMYLSVGVRGKGVVRQYSTWSMMLRASATMTASVRSPIAALPMRGILISDDSLITSIKHCSWTARGQNGTNYVRAENVGIESYDTVLILRYVASVTQYYFAPFSFNINAYVESLKPT